MRQPSSDIYLLDITVHGFFRWLHMALRRIEPIVGGILACSWDVKPESLIDYGGIVVARLIPGEKESELELLFDIWIMPLEPHKTMVELERAWGKPLRSTHAPHRFDGQSHPCGWGISLFISREGNWTRPHLDLIPHRIPSYQGRMVGIHPPQSHIRVAIAPIVG